MNISTETREILRNYPGRVTGRRGAAEYPALA